MKKVDIKTLNDNFIEAIGKEWMLIASGNRDHFNVMTASWGCVGWLWNKPVAVIFVRLERFTHDFIEDNAVVTLSFLGKDPDMRRYTIFAVQSQVVNVIKSRQQDLCRLTQNAAALRLSRHVLRLSVKSFIKTTSSLSVFSILK